MAYDVFWDVEIPIGENWDQWIRTHIANAKVLVVFWTKNSAASLNVQHEAAIAREEKKLVPALLDSMRAIDLPMGFYTGQAASLHDWGGQAAHPGYSQLVRAIRSRLEADDAKAVSVIQQAEATDLADLNRKASEGDAAAQAEIGYRYSNGIGVPENKTLAVEYYRRSAEQGNSRGQTNLGVMYRRGMGGLPKNDAEAVKLWRLAADQGNHSAQYNLANLFANGLAGLAKDECEAVRLYKLSADQGNPLAQSNLGVFYEKGAGGLERDEKEAVRLYRLAAEQQYTRAQYNLAVMYDKGVGVPEDKNEALRLYKLAAQGGHRTARWSLGRLFYDEF
jgi:TPR repeat protein